jgi:PIN domain nuclease of toxin-antitoxin system
MMRLLPDTHLLLWSAGGDSRLSTEAVRLLDDFENEVYFSTVSIWEVAIKHARERPEFVSDPRLFRNDLLGHGYRELAVSSEHAIGVATLPAVHRDPFDRLLVAQAMAEGLTLLTTDTTLLRYPGDIRRV